MARISKVAKALLLAGLSGIFLYAGIMKAADPAGFALDIDHYRLLPWSAVVLQAIYLPWLEIVCAGALLFRKTRTASLWLLLAMMSVFLVALLSAALRGLDIGCGCFGGNATAIPLSAAILRDAAILAGIAWLLKRGGAGTLASGTD